MRSLNLYAVLLFIWTILSSTAYAQTDADISDAINQNTRVEDARRAQQGILIDPEGLEEFEIDGESGVYVLNENDIFYVASDAGVGWSENPLRTIDDAGSSGFTDAVITAGIKTQIAEKFDLGLAVTSSNVEFFEDFAPSSRTVSSSINVGMPIKGTPLYVGLGVNGGRSFDEDFNNGTWFYGANANISAATTLGPKTLGRATFSGSRSMSEISDNDTWNATGDVEVTHVISPKMSVGAQARLTRTSFDDFFEDVTFAERNDWQYGASIKANYAPNTWLTTQVSAGYENRDSGFFLSSYDGFDASVSLTGRKQF